MWRVRHGSECQVTPSPWSGVSLANTCKKPEPLWEMRNNGREIYQGEIAVSCHQSWEYLAGRNSRVTIGVSKSLFDSVDYNGTMFVDDEKDDDWVRSCSVLSDTFLFIKIGLVWGMLDINNFYILISNRQQNNKACKTTVTHHFFILFSLYSSLNLPIGVYWQMKWIHISEKELKNPQKFDKLIRATPTGHPWIFYSDLGGRTKNFKFRDSSSDSWLQDPKKQQWKPKTPISWVLNHSVDKDQIRKDRSFIDIV